MPVVLLRLERFSQRCRWCSWVFSSCEIWRCVIGNRFPTFRRNRNAVIFLLWFFSFVFFASSCFPSYPFYFFTRSHSYAFGIWNRFLELLCIGAVQCQASFCTYVLYERHPMEMVLAVSDFLRCLENSLFGAVKWLVLFFSTNVAKAYMHASVKFSPSYCGQ